MTNWTDEQRRIISDLKDSNILVSAAAGSGKTAVLVERIITFVRDQNEDLESFLVVTFTNEAAAGMKRKIQKALVKAIEEGKNKNHLRTQLSMINKAQITTFHSFCLEVIRKNFQLVALDPTFGIGDTNELDALYRDSIEEVLEKAYGEGNEDFLSLVEGFAGNRKDSGLFDIVDNTYKFIQSFEDPFKWLEMKVEILDVTGEGIDVSPWYSELANFSRMSLRGFKSILEKGIGICLEPDGPKQYEAALRDDINNIHLLLLKLDEGLESYSNALISLKNTKASGLSKAERELVSPEKQSYLTKVLRESYKRFIDQQKVLFDYNSVDECAQQIANMYSSMSALKSLVEDVDQVYTQKKMALAIVDYNDLERYALEILSEDGLQSSIAREYKERFKYIFIDEYQDINGKQEAIVSRLKRDNNLFMVGDVKQSIYRFRLADPSIFNDKYKKFDKDSENPEGESEGKVVELNKNFRSRREILDSTNHLFCKIMTPELGEIRYDENRFLNTDNEKFENLHPVEFNLIDLEKVTNKSDNDSTDDSASDDNDEVEFIEKIELEARFTANRIKELLEEDIYDEEADGHLRKIQYKDIVILLRSVKNWAGVYEDVFRREKIPFYHDGGGGYFGAIEVQVVVNLLRLIDNKMQDIPLLSVMRSPIGGFSMEELVHIRTVTRKGTYYNACKRYIREEEESENQVREDIKLKLEDFFEKITAWRDKSRFSKLEDLIWEILLETNYYGFVGALQNGKQRQANLRLLVDKASSFTAGNTKGLYEFLVYIEKIQKKDKDSTSAAKILGANDNVVRLMSIHSSKGLEYPVVFLSFLDKGFNRTDSKQPVLLHKDLGIGPNYVNLIDRVKGNTLAKDALRIKNELEGLSEELRILYVGMTRAIDRLILLGTIDNLESKQKTWSKGSDAYTLYKSKSYLDWIGSCMFEGMDIIELGRQLDGRHLKDFFTKRFKASSLLDDSVELDELDVRSKLHRLSALGDDELLNLVDERLSFRYPTMDSGKAPSKLSVTSIKHATLSPVGTKGMVQQVSDTLKYDGNKHLLSQDAMKYAGAEIGNLIHLIMEHMNFEADITGKGIETQLESFVENGLISELQEAFIKKHYLDKIHGFFDSSIGKRLLKSGIVKKEVPFFLKKKATEIFGDITGEDSVIIQGIIDCYFEEDGEIVILDYKTDSLRNRQLSEIAEEYRLQIETYKEAIERITGKTVKESYLYLFSVGEVVPV